MLFLIQFEFFSHIFNKITPLFVQIVVLLKLCSNMTFVLFIVSSNLRFPLLENLDFKPSLPRPLLPQIFIKFFDGFVLELFAFRLSLLLEVWLLSTQPSQRLHQRRLKYFHDSSLRYDQTLDHGLLTLGVTGRLHLCLLKVIIRFEGGFFWHPDYFTHFNTGTDWASSTDTLHTLHYYWSLGRRD